MTTRNYQVILVLLLLLFSCVKDKITKVSDSILINSSYSLPIGTIIYQVNDYFETLDTIHAPWSSDSVAYNDTVYPNILNIIEKTDNILFNYANLKGDDEKIKSVTFRIIIENSYPTEVRAQVYFTSNMTIVDSLFEKGIESVQPAAIDQNGIISSPNIQYKDILLSQEMLNNLANYSNIEIYGEVFTKRPDIKIVKFYPDNKLKIHIGIRIEMEFNLEEL